ncbi:MAG TPA: hypothetical protein DDW99_01950, partial [Ruminococcaceae bacterium]|nr:hypothetical protein [Oscillospiraceae bacterium]
RRFLLLPTPGQRPRRHAAAASPCDSIKNLPEHFDALREILFEIFEGIFFLSRRACGSGNHTCIRAARPDGLRRHSAGPGRFSFSVPGKARRRFLPFPTPGRRPRRHAAASPCDSIKNLPEHFDALREILFEIFEGIFFLSRRACGSGNHTWIRAARPD